ncbi:MAG: 3-methyl-2-oxobutanoate hydroxymethyltransferase, partial [Pseudomonadota bacterium]
VLVIYDLLGMNEEFKPRFVRRYDDLGRRIRAAVDRFVEDVRTAKFPSLQESFGASEEPAGRAEGAPAERVEGTGYGGGEEA